MSYDYDRKYVEGAGITSGFFNSNPTTHDRKYTAEQMSSMFDGIIRDGVYSTIGNCFAVRAQGEGLKLTIDAGKAWFNHTWIVNDAMVITEPLDDAPAVMNRIDAVCIEVNRTEAVRETKLVIVTGEASDEPQRPTLLHDGVTEQYALAYISVGKQVTEITDADIENVVGTEETPFVTGALEQVDITELLQQWTAQATEQREGFTEEFNTWFATVEDTLDSNTAGHLINLINDVWAYLASFGNAEEIEY